jgi:hypothetical protein
MLFFGSERPGGCGSRDLWVSVRQHKHEDAGWAPPVNLGCTVNFEGFDDGPTWLRDRGDEGEHHDVDDLATIFFTSLNRPGGLGDFDIWESHLTAGGSFTTPINVAELNSPFRDTRTAVRRDGLEIFLTSQRPGSLAGSLDLWTSTRATRSSLWSVPVNAGEGINSSSNDGAPALSQDGTTMYLYSNRPGGYGANDLYVSAREERRMQEDSPADR